MLLSSVPTPVAPTKACCSDGSIEAMTDRVDDRSLWGKHTTIEGLIIHHTDGIREAE